MLDKLVRRLRLRSPEAPVIPGIEVIDWRVDELKSGSTVVALCHKDSKLRVVSYKQSCPDEKQTDNVDLTTVFPSYKAQFALYHQKHPEDKGGVSVKRTQILDLMAAARGPSDSYEVNPNVVIDHEVNDELIFNHEGNQIHVPLAGTCITGLVFKKYDCTLDELVIRGHRVDVKLCLKSVAAALQYLHKMGLVHGCLSPHHVFVKRGKDVNHFSLGDFASAHNTGDVITFKTGENRWNKRKTPGVDFAEEEDDWYAFRKLTEWLVKETGEKVEDYADIEALVRR